MKSISHDYIQLRRKDMLDADGNPPQEQKFRSGKCSPVTSGVTSGTGSSADSSASKVEARNTAGIQIAEVTLNNASDGTLIKHAELFTMQVRRKDTGEILSEPLGDRVFTNVYNWTKRSITILANDTNAENGVLNRACTLTYPYDIEVYDANNPKSILTK